MKKLLSLLLALSLICAFSAGSFMFAAGSGNPVIKVASVETLKNSSASVAVKVQNSPGVTALKITVAFPEDLTLSSVQFNSALGERVMTSPTLESPVILNWFDGLNNHTGDFAFATLNFDVAADAVNGDKDITVSYNADDVANIDGDEVAFEVESGKITVIDSSHTPGDINDDDTVDNRDLSALLKHLTGWTTDVTVDVNALDVNGDGVANNKDFTRLFRYLSDCDVMIY